MKNKFNPTINGPALSIGWRAKGKFLSVAALFLGLCLPASAQVPQGWQKLTGQAKNYSGVTDGITGDRENSYAWSMAFHGGYLYVGTSRDIVGQVLVRMPTPPNPWPVDVPVPTDLRGRICRMKLDKSVPTWELFYLPPQLQNQMDLGYRMMKEFTSTSGKPVLYVGGAGRPYCQMLAIDSQQKTAVPIFTATALSVRAMAEYKNQFFWASEINKQPTIWYSSDPLKEYTLNPATQYDKITVPNDWFTGADGAEILDIVPFNNVMYVFFFNHDWDHAGFWCAELSKVKGNWHWELIVGDQTKGAKYPAGMGRPENGGATPFIFKDKMYVGTISTTMWRFLLTGYMDPNNIPPTGTQLFRFDKKDKWERVMPPSSVTDETWVEAINGFANPLNLYLWRFAEQSGKLYAGTFDARIALEEVGMDLSSLTLWNPKGFDLYSTTDGNFWMPEALDGFQDQFNYGARTLLTDPSSGDLYLGTANPFYGCQVWRKKAK